MIVAVTLTYKMARALQLLSSNVGPEVGALDGLCANCGGLFQLSIRWPRASTS